MDADHDQALFYASAAGVLQAVADLALSHVEHCDRHDQVAASWSRDTLRTIERVFADPERSHAMLQRELEASRARRGVPA